MKPRSRASSNAAFERLYGSVPLADGSIMRDWNDPEIQAADPNLVWTVVEGDTGKLYLVPGFATVNYLGRVLCERPWPPEEERNPGYVY